MKALSVLLILVQQDCEFIENDLARVGLAARNGNSIGSECRFECVNCI